MAKNNVRAELKEMEGVLQNVTKCDLIGSESVEVKYKSISSVIDFMKRKTDHIQSDALKSLILVIGATGAGKSTLVNYLHSANNFVVSKHEGKLEVTGNSIAPIGDGKGSTTLFPNMWSSSFGNFLDCPGEGDTRGIIAEAMNSIFKSKVSRHTEQVKIVFVVPQASLGNEGGYGMSFKNALDKNAQFLSDIQHFKNSMALVISCASVKKTALENSVESIKTILNEHANPSAYKDAVSHVISSQNVATFSKPSEQLEPGDFYCPPSWNLNQREIIIELIENLPFTSISPENFFNTSTSADVREVMNQALEIVKMKAGLSLKDLVEKALPFHVFAVELKPFVKYLGGLVLGHHTDLSSYMKILAWNNYFKIKPHEEFNQLNEEMIFLSQFVKGLNENEIMTQNWAETAGLIKILTTTKENIDSIINCPGNNFSKWTTRGNVTTKPSSDYANEILENMKSLHAKYEELEEIESLKDNQNSKYFDEKTIQAFSHNKSVSYTETVRYNDVEDYEEEVVNWSNVEFTVKETKQRLVDKTKEETYIEKTPVTKYREETETDYGALALNVFQIGMSICNFVITAKSQNPTISLFNANPNLLDVNKTKQVAYEDCELTEKTRQVNYTDIETYEEDVTKSKQVKNTKIVSKSRPVVTEKEEEKIRNEAVYKDEILKEFNFSRHQEDINRISDEICTYRKLIEEKINMYPKAQKLGEHEKDSIISVDKFEKEYEDLQKLWQAVEYEAYFAQNPNNSLTEFDFETIADIVKGIK